MKKGLLSLVVLFLTGLALGFGTGWRWHERAANGPGTAPDAVAGERAGTTHLTTTNEDDGLASGTEAPADAGPSAEVVSRTVVELLGGPLRARIELIGQWAAEDPAAAFAKATGLGEEEGREEAVCRVLEVWAAMDLDAALAAWEAVPDLKSRWSVRQAIADGAACTHPAQAFQLLTTGENPDASNVSLTAILRCWVGQDPTAAVAAATSLKTRAQRAEACGSVAFALAETNPAAAFAWAAARVDPDERQAACAAVFAGIVDGNPNTVVGLFDSIANSDLRRKLTPVIVEKLTALDPARAVQWAVSLPAGASRTRALETAMTKWIREDPRSAAAFAVERGIGHDDACADSALAALAGRDPAAAGEMLSGVTDARARLRWITGLIRDLGYSNEKDQSELIVQMADALPDSDRAGALAYAVSALGSHHPDSARRVLELIPPGEARNRALADLSSAVARENPSAGVELARTLPDSALRDQALADVVGNLAQSDLAQAVGLLKELPSGGHRTRALEQMLNRWTTASPDEAFNFVRSLPANELSHELMLNCGATLARVSPDEAQARAAELPPGAVREGFLQGVCSVIASESPAQAALVVSKMSPGQGQAIAALNVVDYWVGKDPQAAAAWVEAFPMGETRTQAISKVALGLASEDPAAAGAWAQQFTGAERDVAHAAAAEILAFEQPSQAAAWATEIKDPGRRDQSIRRVAVRWARFDRPAADRWLHQLGYPEDQRQRLLNLSRREVSDFMQAQMFGHGD